MTSAYSDILTRIEAAIEAARTVFARFTPGAIETEYKIGHDPVTEADRAVDAVLRQNLLRDGEGWLSEESVDDVSRLSKSRVWVVDPLDGTREFVQQINVRHHQPAVHEREAYQRNEQHRGRHIGRDGLIDAHQAKDNPGLTSHLG